MNVIISFYIKEIKLVPQGDHRNFTVKLLMRSKILQALKEYLRGKCR